MKEYVAKIIFETNSANLKIDQTSKKVKELGKTTNQVSKTGAKGFKDLGGAMNMLPGPIGRVVTSFQTLKVAMISSGIGAIVVAAGALGALFVTAAKKGAEFGKAMSGLKAVTGATDEEMKALSQSAKELGSSTAFTATQVAELQTEYAKLGKSTPEILAATEATLNLAAALDVGLSEAASLAGSTINAFGLQADDTRRVADVLAASTTNAGLEFSSLVESLKVAAPAARGTGVELEETVAMLGVLADNSIKGSRAGTGLSRMLSELKKQGITLQEAFDKVNSSTDGYITATDLAKEAGGKILFTLAKNKESIGDLKTELEGASEAFEGLGAAAFVAETRLDNLDGDLTKLDSAWEGFLLNIEDGEGILNKGARVVVKYATAVVGAWTDITQFASAVINENISTIKEGSKFLLDFVQFIAGSLALKIETAFIQIKEAAADVPIIGKGIKKEELQKRRKEIAEEFDILRENVGKSAQAFRDYEDGQNIIFRIMKRYFDMKKSQILLQKEEKEGEEEGEGQGKKTIQRITDLIKIQEELLKQAKLMSGATEKDIALRNDRIATINEEIKRLKALRGIKFDIERIDTENLPKLEARGAKRVEVENDVTQQARLGTVERVRDYEYEYDTQERLERAKIDTVYNTLETISNLSQLFANESEKSQKKAFQIQKAARIAQTLMSTYESATQSYNSMAGIPYVGPALGFAAAAAAVTAGLLNVKNIAAQQFESAGIQSPSPAGETGLGAGTGAGLGSQAPQFNIVGQSGFNQIASALGQQPPVQAFVVAQDVTTAQQLQNNTIQTATF